jgi:NADH-quinone oxidoreductase subunit K
MNGTMYYLVLSAILFSLGAFGVLVRRNAIVIFMCIELMLNAVNLSLVAFSNAHGTNTGHVYVFFVMAIAAAEAAVGLAIFISIFRNYYSIRSSDTHLLQG